jgi:hypothetical protein
MTEAETGCCPNCESELESVGAGERVCPVCHFSERPCPDCDGFMWLQVEVPEGVIIEEGGLPLARCESVWVCRNVDCGLRRPAEN